MSDSLRPHGLHHSRPPCPSPTPGVDSNSCPLSWRCHPAISSSVIPFSSHLQSFPASRSLQKSQFFFMCIHSFNSLNNPSPVSLESKAHSFTISPSNQYSRLISFRMDWLDLLAVQGTLGSLLQHHSKASILRHSAFLIVQH